MSEKRILTVEEPVTQTDRDLAAFEEANFQNNPIGFITDILGCKLWYRQEEIVDAVWKYKHVYVHSANSIGKTWLAGRLALAYYMGHVGPRKEDETKVIIVGAKFDSLRLQTWAELGAAYYDSTYPIGGRLQARIFHANPEWPKSYIGIFGTDKDNPENIQGFHAANMLIIVEEASKLDSEVMKALEGCAVAGNNHILCIGNPIRTEGIFFDRCTDPNNAELEEKGIRKVIKVSALEAPNIVFGKDIFPGMPDRTWVEQQKEEYGEESPFYQARVLGEFPTIGEDQIIPLETINQACSDERLERIRIDVDKRVLALDIARKGEDLSAIVGLSGDYVELLIARRLIDTTVTRDWFKQAWMDWRKKADTVIDENGLGGGPFDELRKDHVPIRGWVSQSKAHNSERFADLKSEVLWSLRERFIDGMIAIPDSKFSRRLCNDLAGYRYEFDNKGRIKSIDPTKSPDLGDALVMAHWMQNGGKISLKFEVAEKRVEDKIDLGGFDKIASSIVNRDF